MDMTPPEAPIVLARSIHQEASAAFDRMVELQAWLATEQAGVPALPDVVTGDALAPYLLALDAYWKASPSGTADGVSRRSVVATRFATAARDLAILARQDGHLDETELALIQSLTGISVPPNVIVREPLFDNVPYAGVILIQDALVPDRTLMFSPEGGWESFPRLIDAHAELEGRARIALARSPDLPGIARQDLTTIGLEAFVASREIAGDVFGKLIDRLIDVQKDKLRQAWFEYSLDDGSEARGTVFLDTAVDALRLENIVDVQTALGKRHAALMETFNAERLARVPVEVAQAWTEAEHAYRTLMQSVVSRETTVGLHAPMDLPAYASSAIGEQLHTLGVSQDPADIEIRIDRGADVAARVESLQALFDGPAPAKIRLVDLAYQNIAAFDRVRLSGYTNDGQAIATLSDTAIRDLVRTVDLAARYRGYVDETFRSGTDAAMRGEHASMLQRAHMRHLLAEARLSYYLADAPRSFRDDRAERAYHWVEAVLDAPAANDRARVEGHEIVVRQMTYLGTPMRDVLAIGVKDPASVPSVVLYTPDAPDGITFREFEDRTDAGKRFFYHPSFREYLLDRLPADNARVLPNGTAREFAGDHLANWVLGSGSSSGYTKTEAPFEEKEIRDSFLTATYDLDVRHGLRNIRTFTRSADEANWGWLVAQLRGVTVDSIVGKAIKGVVTAPAQAAQAAWRLYDNVKAGDHAEAFVDFADFYNASLAVASPTYAASSGTIAHAITGARFRAAGRLVEARPAVQPTVVFEPRFMARDVRKTGRADRNGIFTIEGKRFIEHDGMLYRVVRDNDYATWRLSRPEGNSTVPTGPAIQRTAAGTWVHRRVGLKGGSGRGQGGSAERLPDLYDELQAEVEIAFRDPVERELVATRIRYERERVTGQTGVEPGAPGPAAMPPAISAGQRLRWNDALARARTRLAARSAQPNAHGAATPVDLTPDAGPFRLITRADAPADLWYYDNRPFQNSGFERHRGSSGYMFSSTSHGYSNDVAEITARFDAHGVHGVRLTTVPPTSSLARINQAMGTRHIIRSRAFAVRIDPRSLYEPVSFPVRQRYVGAGRDRNAQLVAPNGGPGNVFIARPIGGGPLRLGRGQFDVMNTLPAEAAPRTP